MHCQIRLTENIGNLPASRRCLWVRTTFSTVWSAASISEPELQAAEKDCLMYCPFNKVMKCYTKRFLALGGLLEDKLCGTLQAMAPINVKTVYKTSSLHIESNPYPLGLLSPTHGQRSQQQNGQFTLQSFLISNPKFLKATHHAQNMENKIPRSMAGEALSWRSRRASQHPAVQSHVHILEKRHTNFVRSPLLVGPRWENTNRGQTSAFPSETSRFAPLIFAHRGSTLPWLVDDRAALQSRQIWCVPTQ